MVASVRVTGFMIDDPSTSATEVQINPVITARWVPVGTVGITGRRRTALYRTHFVLLEPLSVPPELDRP